MANQTVRTKIQQRRGTSAEWESKNPVLAFGEIGYSDGGVTKIGDGKTPWNALPAFATTRFTFGSAGWGDIARIAAAGEANKYFHVGDEKTITLTTGEEITLVILGFEHDDLTAGGKAPITIGMKNCLATRYSMNGSDTNRGGWDSSVMRAQTMATLLTQLPSDLQSVIKAVNKKASTGNRLATITTSSDKLFLLSAQEICEQTQATVKQEGTPYAYYKTVKDSTLAADRIKYYSNGGGAAAGWWLRSPYPSNAASFLSVSASGGVGGSDASLTYGVSFGFCI